MSLIVPPKDIFAKEPNSLWAHLFFVSWVSFCIVCMFSCVYFLLHLYCCCLSLHLLPIINFANCHPYTTSPNAMKPNQCTPSPWKLSKKTKNVIWSILFWWISLVQKKTNKLPSFIDKLCIHALYNINMNSFCWRDISKSIILGSKVLLIQMCSNGL